MLPNFGAIPSELRNRPRWVVWKGPKVPFCATAVNSTASVSDPGTWSTFNQAQGAFEEGGYEGVGFVLNGDGIVGIDLDKCVRGGQPEAAAMSLMERAGCRYVELSPSGCGLRGFGFGPNVGGCRGKIDGVNAELYARGRYLTVTGRPLLAGPIAPLPGFESLIESIRERSLQKRTEVDRSHPSFSSVGIPPSTLPQRIGERNRCLFELARRLKGQMPGATAQDMRSIVLEWHAHSEAVIGTKEFAVTWADFTRAWDRVRLPHGETMRGILSAIDDTTQLPAGICALSYGPHARHLARVCIALQAHHGSEPFFLSARQAGEVLGVHFTEAAKMLAALVADGVLTLISKGVGKMASRYRYAQPMSHLVRQLSQPGSCGRDS